MASEVETFSEFFARLDDGVESGRIGMAEMRREFELREQAIALLVLDALLTHQTTVHGGFPVVTVGVIEAYRERYTQPAKAER